MCGNGDNKYKLNFQTNQFMKKNRIKLLLPLVMLLIGCVKDNNILLQAGKYTFTKLDYTLLNVRTNNEYTNPQQLDKLIDNAYILAFALDNRYDTIKILSKKLFYGMRLYSAEVNGYVWNKKVKPYLKISDEELKTAYKKRSVQYTFESIFFPDASTMEKYIKAGSNIKNEKDFLDLKKRLAKTKEITCSTFTSIYPFNQLSAYSEQIIKAKKGEVFQPIAASRGNYILRIVDIQNANQRTFAEEKPFIEKQLLNMLSEKYIKEREKEIVNKARPVIYDKEILYMTSRFDSKTRQWSDVNNNRVLMNYQFEGKTQFFTAGDLKEYLACIPLFIGSPSKAIDMKRLLYSFLMDIYLYDEAKKMNAETDEEFIAFKRYYQNKLFVRYCNEQYVSPKMKVTYAEVQRYYDENKRSLNGFESATVSIYKFNDEQSAFNGYVTIKNLTGKDNQNQGTPVALSNFNHPNKQNQSFAGDGTQQLSNLPGIKSVSSAVLINAADTTFDANLIIAINQSTVGQTLMPLKIKDEFYVAIIKNKIGIATLPFKYAKNILEKMLPQKKAMEVHDSLIKVLKAKYPLKTNNLKEYMIHSSETLR